MLPTEEDVLIFIRSVRESFSASVVVYTQGNCYQFYEILKTVFPTAEPYYAGHVWTKINNQFYDIRGRLNPNTPFDLQPITDGDHIVILTQNKCLDKDRSSQIVLGPEDCSHCHPNLFYWDKY